MRRLCLTGFLALALTSCQDPTGLENVLIAVDVTPERIAPGEIATIVVRFTNAGAGVVEIPDRCVYFEITNAQGSVVVGEASVICALVLRAPIKLGPFQTVEERSQWRGDHLRQVGNSWTMERVPDGMYRVYGRLDGRRSAPDTIEVVTVLPAN